MDADLTQAKKPKLNSPKTARKQWSEHEIRRVIVLRRKQIPWEQILVSCLRCSESLRVTLLTPSKIGAFSSSNTRGHSTDILEIQRGLHLPLEEVVEETQIWDHISLYTMRGLFWRRPVLCSFACQLLVCPGMAHIASQLF